MSTQPRIYLDWNATAPLCDAARAAMTAAMAEAGNPSSQHAEGRRTRDRIERARRAVAGLVGRAYEQVVFTSGGTEANALGVLALAAAAERRGAPRVIATTAVEHPSLRGAVQALVHRGWTEVALGGDQPGVVAVGYVNHELGTLLDLAPVRAARERGALVHFDVVQAAGKVALAELPADALAVSAHKLGGPQGVGALVVGLDEGLPIVEGGHQERGRRPGTENVLGIVGFGAAAASTDPGDWPRVAALGDDLERGLVRSIPATEIQGPPAPRVGGTISARFAGALGQDVVIALDLAGVAVSTGAACTSGSLEPSPVLLALGRSRGEAMEAVRFSIGRTTTATEIERVLRVVPELVERARRHR
jgi:cysteine desulfurase